MTQLRRAVVMSAALLFAGCSGGSTDLAADPDLATLPAPITDAPADGASTDGASTTASTTSDAAAEPSATESAPTDTSATATTPAGAEPEPDWVEIIQQLALTNHSLQAEPDEARITDYCSDPSPCLDTSDIRGLAVRGERLVNAPLPIRPETAELIDTSEDLPWNEATYSLVRVTRTFGVYPDDVQIIGPDDEVVFDVTPSADGPQPGDLSTTVWTITRDSGEWRVFEIVSVDE